MSSVVGRQLGSFDGAVVWVLLIETAELKKLVSVRAESGSRVGRWLWNWGLLVLRSCSSKRCLRSREGVWKWEGPRDQGTQDQMLLFVSQYWRTAFKETLH